MKKIIEKYSNRIKLPWTKGSRSPMVSRKKTDFASYSAPVYSLVREPQRTLGLFERLRQEVVSFNEQRRNYPLEVGPVRMEWGRLPGNREFFYVQPWSEKGLLFEQEQNGWIVARADNLVQDKSFLRDSQAWDVVNLYEAEGSGVIRISSSRYGNEPMGYVIYQELLFDELAQVFGVGYV